MYVAATGHRPSNSQMGGFDDLTNKCIPAKVWLRGTLSALREKNPDLIGISGMALGWDTWFAQVCEELKIPFIAAIPFVDQYKAWQNAEVVKEYKRLLRAASEVIFVDTLQRYKIGTPGSYHPGKLIKRDCYMVDRADLVLACYDNSQSGGTFRIVEYAKKVGRPVVQVTPQELGAQE